LILIAIGGNRGRELAHESHDCRFPSRARQKKLFRIEN